MPTDSSGTLRRWFLLIYRVSQEPPGRRTYVWRQLKGLGAVYLQQAAAILPDRPEARRALDALAERIRADEGEVSLLETTSPALEWEQGLIDRFNTLRDAEYAELGKALERFEDDIRRETRKGKFTFAELEDVESDWEKLHRWQTRIEARDYFGAPDRQRLVEALRRGATELADFATVVEAHEAIDRPESSDG